MARTGRQRARKPKSVTFWGLVQLAIYQQSKKLKYRTTPIPIEVIRQTIEDYTTRPGLSKRLRRNWWEQYCKPVIALCIRGGYLNEDDTEKTIWCTSDGRRRFHDGKWKTQEQDCKTPTERLVSLAFALEKETNEAKKTKAELIEDNKKFSERIQELELKCGVEHAPSTHEDDVDRHDHPSDCSASTATPTRCHASNSEVEVERLLDTQSSLLRTPAQRVKLIDPGAAYPTPESAPRPRRLPSSSQAGPSRFCDEGGPSNAVLMSMAESKTSTPSRAPSSHSHRAALRASRSRDMLGQDSAPGSNARISPPTCRGDVHTRIESLTQRIADSTATGPEESGLKLALAGLRRQERMAPNATSWIFQALNENATSPPSDDAGSDAGGPMVSAATAATEKQQSYEHIRRLQEVVGTMKAHKAQFDAGWEQIDRFKPGMLKSRI